MAYTGPGTDEASQFIRTIHPALAERVSRFEENVARCCDHRENPRNLIRDGIVDPVAAWSKPG